MYIYIYIYIIHIIYTYLSLKMHSTFIFIIPSVSHGISGGFKWFERVGRHPASPQSGSRRSEAKRPCRRPGRRPARRGGRSASAVPETPALGEARDGGWKKMEEWVKQGETTKNWKIMENQPEYLKISENICYICGFASLKEINLGIWAWNHIKYCDQRNELTDIPR